MRNFMNEALKFLRFPQISLVSKSLELMKRFKLLQGITFLVVNGFPVKRYHSRINPKKIEADILSYLDAGEGDFYEDEAVGTEEL
eukprot:gene28830-35762_t